MTRLTPGCPDQPRNFTGILHTHRHYTRQCPMHAKPGHQNNTEYPDNRNQRWTIYFDLVKRENPALPAWYSPSSSSNSVERCSPSVEYHLELKSFQPHLQPPSWESSSPLLTRIMPEGASQLHLNIIQTHCWCIQSYLKPPSESPLKRNAGTV